MTPGGPTGLRVYGECSHKNWIIRLILLMLLLGAFAKLRKETVNFIMSVRLSVRTEQLGSHSRILMKFDVCAFFESLSKKFTFH